MELTQLATSLALIAGLIGTAQASMLADTWTVDGGAFTVANQPDYTNGAGGTWQSDQVIASSGTGSGISLAVGGVSGGGAGFGGTYFYSGSASPSFTFTSSTVLDDVASITVSFTGGGLSTFDATSLSFNFNGSGPLTAASFSVVDTGGKVVGQDFYTYTYAWNVGSLATGTGDAFTASWTNNRGPTAFNAFTVTQSTSAVPEPAAFAALAGLATLGAAALRRRRRD